MKYNSVLKNMAGHRLLLTAIHFWTGLYLICIFVKKSCNTKMFVYMLPFTLSCVMNHDDGSKGEKLLGWSRSVSDPFIFP